MIFFTDESIIFSHWLSSGNLLNIFINYTNFLYFCVTCCYHPSYLYVTILSFKPCDTIFFSIFPNLLDVSIFTKILTTSTSAHSKSNKAQT